MMAEYIDHDILIARIQGTGYAEQIKDNLLFIARMIPAADVVERKRGKWDIADGDANVWYCSECGNEWMLNDGTPEENNMAYCPYCGADMREEDDD